MKKDIKHNLEDIWKKKIKPTDLEKLYISVHEAIRKDPKSKSKYAKLSKEEKTKKKIRR